ncbi:MAG: helix-turn-helix domain-containing protein [Candidatus Cloacimonetes bacterium]|jgi:sugar-specific transcriptional regulator TrmB|nr:helix-turn-helix domain-containing protein [Candidatus Cloacimonadota bacterium]
MSNIEKLMEIGLTHYEAKAYNMLIGAEKSTAAEIATHSKIPRSKIYEVLDGLVKKGFCLEISEPVKKFKATNPKYALKHFKAELNKKKETLEHTEKYLVEVFNSLQNTQTPLNFIEVVFNKNSLIEKVDQFISKTQDTIYSFCKPPYMIGEHDSDWQEQQKRSHKNKLTNKTVYQIEYERLDDFLRMIKISQEDGEQIRLVDELPMKFFIFDDNYVIFLMTNEQVNQPKLGFLAIQNNSLAKTLIKVFELYWEQGLTIEDFEIKHTLKK